MYLLQVLQTQRVQRIVHIVLHLLLLLVSFEVFLPHPHIQLDEHDVFCCCSSLVMDTLWQGVLSYDSYSINTLSNLSSDCLLFSFETYSLMDTLWQGVLSYDSYSIDTLSNLSSDCLLFYFETFSFKVYDYHS